MTGKIKLDDEVIKGYAIKCFRDEAQSLLDLIPLLDESFCKAVELILNCEGKLIITGVGKSGHVGEKIAATLASLGTPSFFLNPLDAYHGDLGMIAKGDVVMAISYSGNTDELLRIIPLLIERDIPIIGISSNPESLLSQYSYCHLNIKVAHEADPLNLAPTSSTTATMAMGDALACALVHLRNFREVDFAKYHPGGSLGRKLLSKVRDCMITTNLPIVPPNMKILESLLVISAHKYGVAIVVDDNRLIGIITDGDIRRALQQYSDGVFRMTVYDLCNIHPKTVKPEDKLSEVEGIFLREHIHVLLVVDESYKLIGLIESMSCV